MKPKHYRVWGDLLSVALIFFAAALVASICFVAIGKALPELDRTVLSAIVYAVHFTLAITGACLWYGKRRGAGSRPMFRFRFNWFDAPLTLSGIILIFLAGIVIEPLIDLFPDRYLENLGEQIGSGGVAVLFSAVMAPVAEELFFRGLVLERTSRDLGVAAAVVVSALLFGAVHLPNLPQAVNAFVMGVIMGSIYILTRSLVPVVIIHMVNNAIAYLEFRVFGTPTVGMREITGNDTLYAVIYAASAIVLAVSLLLMWRAAQKMKSNKTEEFSLHEDNG